MIRLKILKYELRVSITYVNIVQYSFRLHVKFRGWSWLVFRQPLTPRALFTNKALTMNISALLARSKSVFSKESKMLSTVTTVPDDGPSNVPLSQVSRFSRLTKFTELDEEAGDIFADALNIAAMEPEAIDDKEDKIMLIDSQLTERKKLKQTNSKLKRGFSLHRVQKKGAERQVETGYDLYVQEVGHGGKPLQFTIPRH